tara:strand:- start:955 stop:1383 length:429 start_codon:yes stop_codon:yes gene_type:complete
MARQKRGYASKITPDVCGAMKVMWAAGISGAKIAKCFKVHVTTFQNVKRNGWNFASYKTYTDKQFEKMQARLAFKSGNNDTFTAGPGKLTVGPSGEFTIKKTTTDYNSTITYAALAAEVEIVNNKIDELTKWLHEKFGDITE